MVPKHAKQTNRDTSARDREALNKQKNRQKQQAKEKRAREKAASQEDGAREEYFLVSDNDPLDIWKQFQMKHASKKLDMVQLLADRGSPRHIVDTAPAPVAERPEATEAWLQSRDLACPVCSVSQRRTIKTQGAGGWHSVLEHLTKCRHTASAETAPAIADAIAGAWRLAAEAASRKKHAREAKQRCCNKPSDIPSKNSTQPSKNPTEEPKKDSYIACKLCEHKFRVGDAASLASHEAACKAKSEKKKQLMQDALDATRDKIGKAEQDAKLKREKLTQAQQKLREARTRGEALAKERKERARAEAKAAKAKAGKKATSYYTPGVVEQPTETKEESSKTLQKAERAVTLAKKRLDDAHQTIEARKKVAEGVRARAEGEDPHLAKEKKASEDKKRLQEEKKLAFMPASKRSSNWQPTKTQKGGKKQSKEVKALAAKTKSEAKKERRNAPREVNDMLQSAF